MLCVLKFVYKYSLFEFGLVAIWKLKVGTYLRHKEHR